MGMSDKIEAFILELLKQEQENQIKIQRNELAQIFGCVPSQINYVISTRFNPEKGYFVQSRRGGGGYVTIRKVPFTPTAIYIGSEVKDGETEEILQTLADRVDSAVLRLMRSAVSPKALKSAANADMVRSDILKSMLETIGGMNL